MGYTGKDISHALRAMGVKAGDCIFLHMSLKKIGPFEHHGEFFDELYNAFDRVIGPAGTLVVPTFNFDFCKGADFDVANTKSVGMGQFAEYVRTRPDAHRSSHPFQSVAAVGRLSRHLTDGDSKTAFSAGGSFDKMIQNDCAIVFLGVPFVETFVHVAEELANVNYRYWIKFKGKIIKNGIPTEADVDFFARYLDMKPEPRIDNAFLAEYLSERGLLNRTPLGEGYVSIASSRDVVGELAAKMSADNRFALLK